MSVQGLRSLWRFATEQRSMCSRRNHFYLQSVLNEIPAQLLQIDVSTANQRHHLFTSYRHLSRQ